MCGIEKYEMQVSIGYQGLEGSFSEMAARKMAKDCGLADVNFVPLKTAEDVILNLQRKVIDYALVATRNSIGGNVEETMNVIKKNQLQLKRAAVFPIHQCLFKLNADIPDIDITCIVSHPQALRQTELFRKKYFPMATEEEDEDTAQAAIRLADGDLSPTCAVICSLEAGKKNGLFLCKKNIEDKTNNRTEFRLFSLPPKNLLVKEEFDDALSRDNLVTEYLGKGAVILVLAFALWGLTFINGSILTKITSLSGYLLAVYLFYKEGRSYLNRRAIKGYWKYYSMPDPDTIKDETQLYHIPRVVRINHHDGHFHLSVFTNAGGKAHISVVGDPAYSFEIGKSRGKFTYEYRPANRDGADVSGFAILNWYKKHPWSYVKKMTGDYFGIKSKEMGSFTFYRISEEEFNDINQSMFLTD